MKKRRSLLEKYVSLLLCLVLVISLAACGSDNDSASDTTGSAGTESSAASSDDSEGTSGGSGSGGTETLKIGALLHQSEWFASVDMSNYYEFNAMIKYVNEELGGWEIGGTKYMLEAVMADGKSDNDALRQAAITLVDAGVDFVVETNDFWVVACEDIFEEAGVLHTSAYCTYTPGYIDAANPLAFTGSNGSVGDYYACFEVLNEYYPDVKSVVFVNDDNGVNEELFNVMSTYGDQYGIEVLEDYIMYAGDTTDYSAVALQIIESGADCFMGNGSPDQYGAILKELRAAGNDAVMACAQGKPVSTVMEYADAEYCYNGFSLGTSTRESDKSENTDILNALVEKDRELNGDEAAANFDGAAANNLYILLQCMTEAGSTDPADVAAAWESMTEIDTIYGQGFMGGAETYGVENHAVGHPKPVCIMDTEAEDGWEFAGWIEVTIP